MTDDQRQARRLLRSFNRGLLLLDGAYLQARFVLDPATGSPVMPMPPEWDPRASRDPEDAPVLYLPDDSDPALQLIVEPVMIDPRTHAAADRHMAYHGFSREAHWAIFKIESARWSEGVCDGDEISAANTLASAEPRLLKQLNADRARLARLCERGAGVMPESPLAVGIDPDGVDVRASLGVARVEFPQTCPDELAARSAIEALAGDPGA